jgi:hypothetical protein
MNGWQVMAAPLAVVVQVGALTAAAVAAAWLIRRLTRGLARRPDPSPVVSSGRPVSDGTVVAAYDGALLDGWPPDELATFIEVGRRSGTSGAYVRAVIARRWAA